MRLCGRSQAARLAPEENNDAAPPSQYTYKYVRIAHKLFVHAHEQQSRVLERSLPRKGESLYISITNVLHIQNVGHK